MELTKEEFQILWLVEEGNGNPEGIVSFLGFAEEDVKHALRTLQRHGLIELQESAGMWSATTTEKAKDLYAQFEHWIP